MDFFDYSLTQSDSLKANHPKPIALRSTPPSPRLAPSQGSSLFVQTTNLPPASQSSTSSPSTLNTSFSPSSSASSPLRRRPRETPLITLTNPKYNRVFQWTPPKGGRPKAVGWAECGDPEGVPCF